MNKLPLIDIKDFDYFSFLDFLKAFDIAYDDSEFHNLPSNLFIDNYKGGFFVAEYDTNLANSILIMPYYKKHSYIKVNINDYFFMLFDIHLSKEELLSLISKYSKMKAFK